MAAEENNGSLTDWCETAKEEWKLLQAIIGRLENNEYKIRSWLIALLTALGVGLFSGKIPLLNPAEFLTMSALLILLFLFIELIHRIPKRRAMNRVGYIEKCLRTGTGYCGPKIRKELSQRARFVPMFRELLILPVYGFYILVILMVAVLSRAAT